MLYSDIDHLYGEDIGVTPTGDIALVQGADRTTQRVIRRLMTAATTSSSSDYPFEPPYGIGLGDRVGDATPDTRAISGLVRSQLLQEASVATQPAPTATARVLSVGGLVISVSYTDLSGAAQRFSFNVANDNPAVPPASAPAAPSAAPSNSSPSTTYPPFM